MGNLYKIRIETGWPDDPSDSRPDDPGDRSTNEPSDSRPDDPATAEQ